MGHKVVSIEPFYENIIRIHKAAHLEKTYENIVLITNAVSNRRNESKLLNKYADNIGGQSLVKYKNETFVKNEKNKYLVETILLDDIVPYLPYKNLNTQEKFKQAILKIDIGGFEPYAFESGNVLFETLDFRVVYMHWV
jgi:FkbM family methyltransferase